MESIQDRMRARPWMVSLHGGHSGDFCDHAEGSLREMLDAAISAGYHTFGVSEHAPRCEDRFLYPNERQLGWTLKKTMDDFDRYIMRLPEIADEYGDRINVLRGFECEVVPNKTYVARTQKYKAKTDPEKANARVFHYFVGSVHYVGEIPIDGTPVQWAEAAAAHGGPESLAIEYYDTVCRMVEALEPTVVGHLDLIKLNARAAGFDPAAIVTSRAISAAKRALDAIHFNGGILDLNTAAWRKGFEEPYPAPWLVSLAARIGIPFCFGDDSHRPSQVGFGIERARLYLLELGVKSIVSITSDGERLTHPL